MARYSSAGIGKYGLGAVNEFKYLVREAHKQGIEVRLSKMSEVYFVVRFCRLLQLRFM